MVLELFQMLEYVPQEILLNTARLVYCDYKEIDYSKLISSILRGFYEEKLLDEVR
jgi:hypothetical protein